MIAAPDAYSANVRAHLIAGEITVALGQVGPSRCMVQSPLTLAPQRAQIVLEVDDRVYRRDVYLPDGISPTNHEVRLRDLTADET